MMKFFYIALAVFAITSCPAAQNIQKVHLIQDDAQDYMVSKIYQLKYVQANDIVPFVMGMTMRYNINSSVNTVCGGNNEQLLTVTCPREMMPYVDDFVAKADRNIKIDGKQPGDIIRGTGITRAVYQPKYRSGEGLVNILVNSVIGTGPAGAVYAYDKNSNQIYWKDNSSNTSFVFEFLEFIDRPAPQIKFEFKLYELRESTLRDLGIEYLAWKNGPGLNIFQTAFDAFSLSSGGSAALTAISGPVGGFLVAPQFDASFIRMLAQKGNATKVSAYLHHYSTKPSSFIWESRKNEYNTGSIFSEVLPDSFFIVTVSSVVSCARQYVPVFLQSQADWLHKLLHHHDSRNPSKIISH